MQRLIDAGEALELIDNYKKSISMTAKTEVAVSAIEDIVRFICPTIDAEPVVRCKDCEHWNKENRFNGNAVVCKCEWFSSYHGVTEAICTHMNDFCSYGAKNGRGG